MMMTGTGMKGREGGREGGRKERERKERLFTEQFTKFPNNHAIK